MLQEIQVDFEGRNPIDSDFHGIKQLLQQLFLKAHINLSELTDLIISQNYVGSVVKVILIKEYQFLYLFIRYGGFKRSKELC